MARLLLLSGGILLLAPIAFVLRGGSNRSVSGGDLPGAVAVIKAGVDSQAAPVQTNAVAVIAPVAAATDSVAAPPSHPLTGQPAPTIPPTAATSPPVPTTAKRSTTVDIFSCPKSYVVVAGDYWLGIAKAYSVSLDALLMQNGATAEQPLYPGRDLCLPADAKPPAPPETAAGTTVAATKKSTTTTQPATTVGKRKPTTTEAPATTAAPKPTTTAPKPTTTTVARTTTTAAPKPEPKHYGDGEIEGIIRAVWPDDLEEKALAVAWRESTFKPTAKNYCCYGLFQIYYDQHKKWLAGLGVNSAEDLYDPQVNAYAALVLYQRAGGWGPWGG